MSFSYLEIWQHMGGPAIAIASVLLVMGLASLTVFLERMVTLRRSRRASRAFAAHAADKLRGGEIDAVLGETQSKEFVHGHLARIVRSGLTTYVHARQTTDISGLPPAERTRRHLDRYMEEIGEDLRRGMSVLASVGSVAPFVGLLGTVVGIISAFQGIAASGSGGLSSVSAGISEALIETAFGLAVAIPAVLAFNYLSTTIAHEEGSLQRSAGELADMVEDWEESRVQSDEVRRERVA
jgi:biopolymer transport protein ExbB